MRVVRQQGILEYLVARDGLFTIQNIFSLLQFLDFFNISGIKGFEDLQSYIEHHICEGKADLATVKTKSKENGRKQRGFAEFFSHFNRYRCFVFAQQVSIISIAEFNNENG